MKQARYAIYYAPAADSALWRRASAFLGRDAASGEALARPAFPELADLDLDALTADPRHYGFHATLRSPFEPADGASESDLIAFAAAFAAQRKAFTAAIAPLALGEFLAFRLVDPCPDMDALHEACVRAFEPFRAALSAADIARRRRAPLTPLQDARMLEFGYPYIFEDFRFHMTLTGRIRDEAVRARVLSVLQADFAELSGPHLFDAIALYAQAQRTADFRVIARFPFGG